MCPRCDAEEMAAGDLRNKQQNLIDIAEKESFCRYYKETTGKSISIDDVERHPNTGKWIASADLAKISAEAGRKIEAIAPFQIPKPYEVVWNWGYNRWMIIVGGMTKNRSSRGSGQRRRRGNSRRM
ncbi:MAG: hypothetical protein LBH43_06005 [Treponema sp.]|nr:hypothetical protein [Treponema sp.]